MNLLVAYLEAVVTAHATYFKTNPSQGGCRVCKSSVGRKSQWGFCHRHYKRTRRTMIKSALIELFGGECSGCGGVFSPSVYDFHHVTKKTDKPSTLFNDCSIGKIAEEIVHCILVCANCHREIHNDNKL